MDHITVTSQREFQDYENLPVGEFLKNIRENQGIDVEKVSKFLKVRIKDINYLENNDIDKILNITSMDYKVIQKICMEYKNLEKFENLIKNQYFYKELNKIII